MTDIGATSGPTQKAPSLLDADPADLPTPEEVRRTLTQRHNDIIGKLRDMATARGEMLFGGQWMTKAAAAQKYRRLWLKGCWVVVETFFLLALLVVAAYAATGLLYLFGGMSPWGN